METEINKALDKTGLSPLLPGAVCVQYRKCGKPNCRCASGKLHGPYHYRTWRKGGKQVWEYVKREDVQAVSEACETNRLLQASLRLYRERTKILLQQWRESVREAEREIWRRK